jgi:hypothetical protein
MSATAQAPTRGKNFMRCWAATKRRRAGMQRSPNASSAARAFPMRPSPDIDN